MKKTIALLILILFYVIPAYSLPITGKEPQGVKDKFFPDPNLKFWVELRTNQWLVLKIPAKESVLILKSDNIFSVDC